FRHGDLLVPWASTPGPTVRRAFAGNLRTSGHAALLIRALDLPCQEDRRRDLATARLRYGIVKVAALVAVPAGVMTVPSPLVALAGTVAVICVLESTWNAAAAPLNLTAVAPVSAEPVIVTAAPAAPLPGVKLVTLGLTAKVPGLDAL